MIDLPRVILKPKEEFRLQGGHLWAFSNEIDKAPEGLAPGTMVDLYHAGSSFLARGFYHPHSLIAFRTVTLQKDDVVDAAFLNKRLMESLSWRERLYPGSKAYRWVFGESDRLPGLIVDRYGDYLTVQVISAGMERLKDALFEQLQAIAKPKGIVWRPDAQMRGLEGLPVGDPQVVWGDVPEIVEIETENGKFGVDLRAGQKTGFYFDQRENRQALAPFCQGKKVLDGFCYSGGFGMAAGRAGAREIVFCDTAASALTLAEANAARNELTARCTFVEGDTLTLLGHEPPGGKFDVISIDPPAFARSKKHLPQALKAYEKLNAGAISALPRGGILATSSCSHHVSRELFLEVLRRASAKVRRALRIIEVRSQAKDHPVLLSMPETEYLKCVIAQVI